MLPHKHYAPGGDHRDGERRAELFGGAVDDLPLEPGETAAGMSGASDGEGSRKRRAGRKVSLAAGARAIKITGKMKKRQVRCLQLCDQ